MAGPMLGLASHEVRSGQACSEGRKEKVGGTRRKATQEHRQGREGNTWQLVAKLATRRGRRPRRVALRSRWPSAPTSAPEGAEGHFATCEAGSPRRGHAPAENGPENQALPKGSRSKKWVEQNASKNAVFSAKSGRSHELRKSSKDLVQKSAQLWAYPLGLGSLRLFATFK